MVKSARRAVILHPNHDEQGMRLHRARGNVVLGEGEFIHKSRFNYRYSRFIIQDLCYQYSIGDKPNEYPIPKILEFIEGYMYKFRLILNFY